MLRKLVIVVAVAIMVPFSVMAQGISWFADANWLNYADGSTPLAGSLNDSSVGCFVQLLWVGLEGVINDAYNYGDGTGVSDDLVVSTIWVGYNVGDDGYFSNVFVPDGGDIVEDRYYFARVWSAPSANYASGLVPSGGAVRYANSSTWQYPKENPVADLFDIAGDGDLNTTLQAIPEPGMIALMALGLMTLRIARRRK
jgi:hypothetical protein